MNKKKPLASISLDLDNQWSYMKIHGDEGWNEYPSYFDIFVPYVLDILDELELKITFFLVGKDADSDRNIRYLQTIAERGHEIGNHSYNHESWLQSYSREEIEKEIELAEQTIIAATGQKPVGFRGPGFSWSLDLLEVLSERGYKYDASTLPTWLGPFARIYYFWKSDLTKEEKKARKELFGQFKDGLRPNKPYFHILKNNKKLLEIPVTTIPLLRVPFHLSYLIYLNGISSFLMKFYLNLSIFFCKITSTKPSYLLHPLDLIGGDKLRSLTFFPGMNLNSDKKMLVFRYVIKTLKKHYTLVCMSEFSESV
jgi:peptidoglycan-N-acetylglucosamine deacetylase